MPSKKNPVKSPVRQRRAASKSPKKKRSLSAYNLFIQKELKKPQYQGMLAKEKMSAAAASWRQHKAGMI